MGQKFVEFSNFKTEGSGLGNQLRAFIKAVIISKITNRDLIVTNHWINKLFECPYDNKWDRGIIKKNYTIKKIDNGKDYEIYDFNTIKEDIIETGGGDLPIINIISNKHHKENKIIQDIVSDKYNFLRKTFVDYLQQPKKEFVVKSKKIIDYDSVDYITLQFRAFFDVVNSENKTMFLLDDFIENFIKIIREQKLETLPIFITTDKNEVTNKIKNRLQKELNSKIIETKYNFGHSAHTQNIETLCDWLILGKSKFIYTTGTSYAITSSLIYNDNCMVYNRKNKNRMIKNYIIEHNL
jgi:hypothetical protein